MSLKNGILNAALDEVAKLHPGLTHLITWFEANEDQVEELLPKLAVAIGDGGHAVPVIEAESPDLAHLIKTHVNGTDMLRENVARSCFGLPAMTAEEANAWLDRASPVDDSRVGSG